MLALVTEKPRGSGCSWQYIYACNFDPLEKKSPKKMLKPKKLILRLETKTFNKTK